MKTGILDSVSIHEYHSNPTIISSTGLKEAKKSSRHFAKYLLFGTESKSYFDFGNAFELALMDAVCGTNEFAKEVAIKPTKQWIAKALEDNPDLKVPKASAVFKKLAREWEEENIGKYIIEDEADKESLIQLQGMIESCMSDPVIMGFLRNSDYQKTLVWEDPETGIKCKTRPDNTKPGKGMILDIKSTVDASPQGFSRQAANLDYPLQAAMQITGVEQSGYIPKVKHYFWLAVEKSEPYNALLHRFQPQDIEYFRDSFHYYLKRAGKVLSQLEASEGSLYAFKGYTEAADNEQGIIDMEIPLFYKQSII